VNRTPSFCGVGRRTFEFLDVTGPGSRLPEVGGRSDVLSRQMAARETYENHCDSFCDKREVNRGDWVLIGMPVRTDSLAFWHHLSILDWLVVPVAEGSNPSTHPTKLNQLHRLWFDPASKVQVEFLANTGDSTRPLGRRIQLIFDSSL